MRPAAPVLACAALLATATAQRSITAPKVFFGHEIGADYFLADYSQLSAYWRKVAAESDRMVLEEIGKTSYGQTMLLAVISSPANLARRGRLREISRRLARARGLTDQGARELAAAGRAVVWIDAGMHATESVAAQNIIELVYRMTAQDDVETRRILDQVILLVCPANPDGMELIAKAYMATRRVGGIPVLYQRYIGHDNNRDYYACSQDETIAISRALYDRWYPQILYNHHQSAPRGTIIFTPPFRDPFNYNVDPLIVRGIDIVAAHMNHRFAREGKPGVISRSGASYSTWWNGGLRTTAYFHNVIGILTESFGSPNPAEVTQTIRRRLPYGDYPQPIASQPWHARQTIEYLQTANRAILDYASRYRGELLYDSYQAGRNSIARGSADHWTVTPKLVAIAKEADSDAAFTDPDLRDPRGYVLPADQSDFAAATRFVNALLRSGIEVHRASQDFEIGYARYPKGSLVVRCDQAYRPHVLDMFEAQWHPDDIGSGGQPVQPYDAAGWTLAMQMGVGFDRVREALDGPFERIEGEAPILPGRVTDGRAGWLASHYDSNGFLATNRLLSAGDQVYWLSTSQRIGERRWPAGTVFVRRGAGTRRRIHRLAESLGVSFAGTDRVPTGAALVLAQPRIGLFDVYGGNMATGWTQWVLEQFEFPVELVFGARVAAGDLRRDFDVLVFHTGLPSFSQRPRRRPARRPNAEEIAELKKALPSFEDWSHIEDRLVTLTKANCAHRLRQFVEDGGTILGMGSQARSLVRMFDLKVRVGTFTTDEDGKRRPTNRSEFFIPGSLVNVEVDSDAVLGFGVPRKTVAMFRGARRPASAPVFEVEPGSPRATLEAPVTYAEKGILASGWAIGREYLQGKAAALRAQVGKGQVFLFGADVLYRGQPLATFKLVFNAILGGSARRIARIR